jgi:hypothetical protein
MPAFAVGKRREQCACERPRLNLNEDLEIYCTNCTRIARLELGGKSSNLARSVYAGNLARLQLRREDLRAEQPSRDTQRLMGS